MTQRKNLRPWSTSATSAWSPRPAALPLPAALWRNADAAELRVDLLAACANGCVRALLAADPADRPSAAEALEHPWFEAATRANQQGNASALTNSFDKSARAWVMALVRPEAAIDVV